MYLTRRLIRQKTPGGDEVWLSGLTGAVDRLSGEEVLRAEEIIARGTAGKDALTRKLVSRGYLYADRRAEQAAFEHLVEENLVLANAEKTVRHLIVCPTYSCNLRCVYCFERHDRPALPGGTMDRETVSLVIEGFRKIRTTEPGYNYSIGLFGGEPLMESARPAVSRILDEARHESLPVMIVTNGVNVSTYLDLLGRYAAEVRLVQLTLDGPEEIHDRRRPTAGGSGTYAAVSAAADDLLELGIAVALRVNIDRDNVRDLPAMREIAEERGWSQNPLFTISLAPVKDHTGKVTNVTPVEELLSALCDVYDADPRSEAFFGWRGFQALGAISGLVAAEEKGRPRVIHCEANFGGFRVAGPDGYIYACPEAVGRPELAVGRFVPSLEVWEEQMRNWTGRSIRSLEECRECGVGPLCGGGCTYAALVRHGDPARAVCDDDPTGAIGVLLTRRTA